MVHGIYRIELERRGVRENIENARFSYMTSSRKYIYFFRPFGLIKLNPPSCIQSKM